MKLYKLCLAATLPLTLASRPQAVLRDEVKPTDSTTELFSALETMQTEFFSTWQGTWTDGIDWTRAVLGTHLTAALQTYSRATAQLNLNHENKINRYFSSLVTYYFGQDALSIRFQAYDDMLWVVLGWLDSIALISQHSNTHFNSTWYGNAFIPGFAHRARIFWDLASEGWDEKSCGGGMIWSPWLVPYKNAITNELFISASVNMYLFYPGDDIDFPFAQQDTGTPHDRKYLDAAIKSYEWLLDSNMTDAQGLYFDGFHIKDWTPDNPGTGKCDIPDLMVYTYNQGVVLTAHRNLWAATGSVYYLETGHALVRNVIAATGWNDSGESHSHHWSGLGRNGVLEDKCDSGGYCSQDGQTFKGIFFHHLTVFCQPLPVGQQELPFHGADRFVAALHRQSCLEYASWVERNAVAALGTKNEKGVMGMWWTVGLGERDLHGVDLSPAEVEDVDYRNAGIPRDEVWQFAEHKSNQRFDRHIKTVDEEDPNNRGRGRTVETHSGGVAVLRAHYEFSAL